MGHSPWACKKSDMTERLTLSLVVQWLRLHASTARGLGLIPGQGTKIHIPQGEAKKKREGGGAGGGRVP